MRPRRVSRAYTERVEREIAAIPSLDAPAKYFNDKPPIPNELLSVLARESFNHRSLMNYSWKTDALYDPKRKK